MARAWSQSGALQQRPQNDYWSWQLLPGEHFRHRVQTLKKLKLKLTKSSPPAQERQEFSCEPTCGPRQQALHGRQGARRQPRPPQGAAAAGCTYYGLQGKAGQHLAGGHPTACSCLYDAALASGLPCRPDNPKYLG
jgi:hypothetical protein